MESLIFIFIIAFLLFDFLFDNLLSWLNVRNWKTTIHSRLKEYYPEKKYLNARSYAKEKDRLSFISSTFNLALILILLFSGGFAFIDQKIALFTTNPAFRAIIFFLSIALAADILGIAFQWHAVFGIEEKYGFNRSTVKIFFTDKIKSYLLAALLGGALFWIIVKIYFAIPDYFWLVTWGVITFFMLFMMLFYSNLIVPLFNKQKPLEEGELRDEIEAFAAKNNFKLDNIYVINGSKRSTKANAYFTGLGPKKRIVLYDTLIAQHTYKELVAILAHEIGHYKKKHTLLGLFTGSIQMLLILFLFNLIVKEPAVSKAIGMETSFHAGLLVFGLLLSPLNLILSMIGNSISRKNEFAADSFAFEKTKSDDLANALIKLSVENLSNLNPHPLYVFFNYGHPPLLKRLENLDTLKEIEDKKEI